MRADVFAAVQDAAAAAAAEALGAEERRLVEKMVLDGKRNGLALPADAREQLAALRTELSGVQLAFSKNMNEEDGHVALSAAELTGVPPDVVAGYPKADGTDVYAVPFKTTDIFPVLKQAVDPAAREKASTAYEGRLAVNTPLLARAIALRREIAGLLGYATWADYQTEPKMVKTGKGVADVRCTALLRGMTR
jgi:Zn-dependent oligopeptidase